MSLAPIVKLLLMEPQTKGRGYLRRFLSTLKITGPTKALMSRSKKKIIVIEDEPLLQESYEVALVDYQVKIFSTAEQALAAVDEFRPDLLIVDLGLPGMDGMAFLRACREGSGRKQLPAIIVSGDIDLGHCSEALNLHVNHLISKPVQTTELLYAIERVLNRRLVA